MSFEYQVFDPSPCCFPKVRVSVLPRSYEPDSKEDSDILRGRKPLTGQGVYFSRGRYALGAAYRHAGLDSKSVLLAPAYHCVTMLDPALVLGADVKLYPLTPGLAPKMEALETLLERTPKPVKALLATHYFGFVREFSQLKQWCVARGIVFIEDCSHTLFTQRYQVEGAGQFGDYVASSPYKFLSSADGGWLYAPNPAVLRGCATQPASWVAELRGIRHCFEIARQPRVNQEDIAGLDDQFASLAGKPLATGADQRCTRPAQSAQYQRDLEGRAALRSSRWLIEHHSVAAIVNRRRANYRRWLQVVADLPGCRPLYPELPKHVVPYMFPLYIDHPMPHFYWLKRLAVPVWRWDEMAISDCPVAQDYRLHLLHLPCHQSLSDDEMNWLLTALGKVLRALISGVQR